MSRKFRIAVGVAIWIAVIAASAYYLATTQSDQASRLVTDFAVHATGHRQRVFVTMDEKMELGVGDPVFLQLANGSFEQVGEVSSIPAPIELSFGASDKVKTGELLLYAQIPALNDQTTLTLNETPQSMEWVLQTMLPPDKRRLIAERISATFERHQDEIVDSLRPVIEAGLRDAITIVESDLERALIDHSDELERIGAKYQTDLVQNEIVPLVRSEIFPIVRYYSEPLATKVGQEMWEEASLWRFGWRYMYDISPLPQRDLSRREWGRFLEEDATPILEKHIDNFVEVQQDIFRDVARNARVQEVIRQSLKKIVRDPEVQQVVVNIVREVFVDNPRLREALRKHWRSPEAMRAFRIASQRLEPTVTEIGELLFGTPEKGITPEFARVLRNRVLRKDERWLLLKPVVADKSPTRHLVLKVSRGSADLENPFAMPGVTYHRPTTINPHHEVLR